MEKLKVGSPNDINVESVGFSGGAYFGHGRCESGVKWWASDIETTPSKAC
jgi:hypothetical protein